MLKRKILPMGKNGETLAVTLPKYLCELLNINAKDKVNITLEDKIIKIKKDDAKWQKEECSQKK